MNTLHHGDCLEVMATLADGSVDAIITDLPYGTTSCHWDSVIPFEPMWEQLSRIIRPNGAIVLFGSEPFTSVLITSNIKMFRYCWIWEKENASNFFAAKFQPLNNTEDIVVFSKGGCNNGTKNPAFYNPQGVKIVNQPCINSKSVGGLLGVAHKSAMVGGRKYTRTLAGYPLKTLKYKRDSNKSHPTQKPIALMEYLIKTYTNENETVLDFTMGSGTTIIAAENTRRNSIGIERDEAIFQLAVKRINAHLFIDNVAEGATAVEIGRAHV